MLNTFIAYLALPLAAVAALDCSTLDNGIYAYTCFSYTECVNGSQGVIKCASNEVFSPDDGLCVIPKGDKFPCADVIDCKDHADKRFPDLGSNCVTYYTCQHHVFYGHSYCPPGTVFDEENQFCNWPQNVKQPCGTAKP